MANQGKREITAEDLAELAKVLRIRSMKLQMLAKAAEEREGKTVSAMGMPMVERAIKSIDGLIFNCQRDLKIL